LDGGVDEADRAIEADRAGVVARDLERHSPARGAEVEGEPVRDLVPEAADGERESLGEGRRAAGAEEHFEVVAVRVVKAQVLVAGRLGLVVRRAAGSLGQQDWRPARGPGGF